jgi:hypothetical protein
VIIIPNLRYGESAYGLAKNTTIKSVDPAHHKGIRLTRRIFAIVLSKNVLCKARMATLTKIRNMETVTKVVPD